MASAPASSTPKCRLRKALIWSCIDGKIAAEASCRVLSRSKIHTRRDGGNRAILKLLALDQRAHAFVREHFEQQGMRNAAVDDVHALHAVARRVERRADLRQHAARDDAL